MVNALSAVILTFWFTDITASNSRILSLSCFPEDCRLQQEIMRLEKQHTAHI
ncbi:hypothetical protein GCM10009413_06050 [Tatumella punctata]